MDCLSSGEYALRRAADNVPDLIFKDLLLPGLDGAGLIERLTTDEKTAHVPIMVLSVDADLARVQAVYNLGARDFLVVPFHMDVLAEKVAGLIAAGSKRTKEPHPEKSASVG